MNNNAHSEREVNGARSLLSQAATLLDESRALSYALVMALAQTPREELSREEIDGLCQLAYELLNKLTKTQEVFQETRQKLRVPSGAAAPRPCDSYTAVLPGKLDNIGGETLLVLATARDLALCRAVLPE